MTPEEIFERYFGVAPTSAGDAEIVNAIEGWLAQGQDDGDILGRLIGTFPENATSYIARELRAQQAAREAGDPTASQQAHPLEAAGYTQVEPNVWIHPGNPEIGAPPQIVDLNTETGGDPTQFGFQIGDNGEVFRFNSRTGTFESVGTFPGLVDESQQPNQQFTIGPGGEVFRFDPGTGSFESVGVFPGLADQPNLTIQQDPATGRLVGINPQTGQVQDLGQFGFPGVDPRLEFGEDRRRFDLGFGEDVFRDRRDFGEDTRRFDLGFNEDVRRFDTTFGEDRFRDRRDFGEDVFRDRRNFGEDVFRDRRNFGEETRQFDTVEGRLNRQLLGDLGVDLGALNLAQQEFVADILRNPSDALARLYFQSGSDSPVPQVTQSDLINNLRNEFSRIQDFVNEQVAARNIPDVNSIPGPVRPPEPTLPPEPVFTPGATSDGSTAPVPPPPTPGPGPAPAPAPDSGVGTFNMGFTTPVVMASGDAGGGPNTNITQADRDALLQNQIAGGASPESLATTQAGLAELAALAEQQELLRMRRDAPLMARGGATRARLFMVGDSPSGRPNRTEEMVVNPTGAPIQVVPNRALPDRGAGGRETARLKMPAQAQGRVPRMNNGTKKVPRYEHGTGQRRAPTRPVSRLPLENVLRPGDTQDVADDIEFNPFVALDPSQVVDRRTDMERRIQARSGFPRARQRRQMSPELIELLQAVASGSRDDTHLRALMGMGAVDVPRFQTGTINDVVNSSVGTLFGTVDTRNVNQDELVDLARQSTAPRPNAVLTGGPVPEFRLPFATPTFQQLAGLSEAELQNLRPRLATEFNTALEDVFHDVNRRFLGQRETPRARLVTTS